MPYPTEHQEQTALFAWIETMEHTCPDLKSAFAIPNGGHRHIVVAGKLKAEGVRRGVPDVFIPIPANNKHGLWLEMKRTKGGSVSTDQRWWLLYLNANGYEVVVAKGWVQAAGYIVDYLGLPERYKP